MAFLNTFFLEKRSPTDLHLYGVNKIVMRHESPFQLIEIFDTTDFGRCLALDGMARVFERDEFIYHEGLIHPAFAISKKPIETVLIAGDGDGGSIREVVKYASVRHVDWVEIDRDVVELCREYMPEVSQHALYHDKVHIHFHNAREYLSKTSGVYDCIVTSVTEATENNPSQLLYTLEYLEIVKSRLAPGGFCVQSAGPTSFGYLKRFAHLVNTYRRVFDTVVPYEIGLPSFGLSWGFVIALSDNLGSELLRKESGIEFSTAHLPNDLSFLDTRILGKLFVLPKYVLHAIETFSEVSTDKQPLPF